MQSDAVSRSALHIRVPLCFLPIAQFLNRLLYEDHMLSRLSCLNETGPFRQLPQNHPTPGNEGTQSIIFFELPVGFVFCTKTAKLFMWEGIQPKEKGITEHKMKIKYL